MCGWRCTQPLTAPSAAFLCTSPNVSVRSGCCCSGWGPETPPGQETLLHTRLSYNVPYILNHALAFDAGPKLQVHTLGVLRLTATEGAAVRRELTDCILQIFWGRDRGGLTCSWASVPRRREVVWPRTPGLRVQQACSIILHQTLMRLRGAVEQQGSCTRR